jgi:hypothetical protein
MKISQPISENRVAKVLKIDHVTSETRRTSYFPTKTTEISIIAKSDQNVFLVYD